MAATKKKKNLDTSKSKAVPKKKATALVIPRVSNISLKAQEILKRTNAAIKAHQTRRWKKKVAITEAKKKIATPVTHHRSYSD